MTDPMDEIRRRVEERVEAEAAQLPPPPGPPEITSRLIQDCLFANQLGDGILYATLFRDRYLYCKNTQEWYEWAGHYWQKDIMNRSLGAVEKLVEHYLAEYKRTSAEVAEAMQKDDEEGMKKLKARQGQLLKRVSQLRADNRRTACLKFAHTLPVAPLAIRGEEFDQRPMLFACANGVLDLETGVLKPGRPGDYLSLASPVEFLGIDYPAPIWERSILEIMHNKVEMAAYLQRLFGLAMTGLVKEKIFPVLYGKTGWNGRTLIVETISYVLGAMAGSIPSEMLLSQKFTKSSAGPSPDVMSLRGLRMAFASEIDENQRFSAAAIKKYTGRDELWGRNPNDKYPTRFAQTHTLFVMTNYLPEAPANDRSFWERMHLINFLLSFVNRDPQDSWERRANTDLDREVRKEAPGILAWLVRGCLLYQKMGLNPPQEVIEASKKYQRDEDHLADFIGECCLLEPGAQEKSSVLYNRYVEWYHDNIGQKEKSSTWFGKQMGQKFDKDKTNGCNVYKGIALRDDAKQGELEGC